MDKALSSLDALHCVDSLVHRLHPDVPLHILDSRVLIATAQAFVQLFHGTVMYAVKSNPTKEVIKTLYKAGIRTFDAASIEELRLVRKVAPAAKIHFMHTVKSREAIREAYFKHGVRVFVIDCADELHKIAHETDLAADLELYIRLALPKNKDANIDFSVKFGVQTEEAVKLLREARLVSQRLGIMFHPGTQSRNPDAFRKGIERVGKVIRDAKVVVDALDVGGGFPAAYPAQSIPSLFSYMTEIHNAVDAAGLQHLDIYCEPGRALVADAGKLIVRIELRKGRSLYINDGIYGGLIEAAAYQGGIAYPARLIRKEQGDIGDDTSLIPFRLCGPTCDSLDIMAAPFLLPADSAEGDWIEISQTGAYSIACRTNFNGFGKSKTIIL